jgi:hypothetical protein
MLKLFRGIFSEGNNNKLTYIFQNRCKHNLTENSMSHAEMHVFVYGDDPIVQLVYLQYCPSILTGCRASQCRWRWNPVGLLLYYELLVPSTAYFF